ncbi:MAG: GNAT family N-acetyltransferase [Actinoplanes sp.]
MTDKEEFVPPKIVTAGIDDAGAVALTLKHAFFDADLAPWLVNDAVERDRIYPGYFEMLVEHAMEHGTVEWTADGSGAAIWYEVEGEPLPGLPGYSGRLAGITAPFTARFVALDEAQSAHHPYSRPHHYLALLGVPPGMQSCGYGGHLLRHHHEQLDEKSIPAYLEATGARNQGLYSRHGYRPHRKPYEIASQGPVLHPMWREPNAMFPPGVGPRRD